jgi:hypothetical protein
VKQDHGFPIEEGYHHKRAYYGGQHHSNAAATSNDAFEAREGAKHLKDMLGMHIIQPEEMQVMEREIESGHRHAHHPKTRYEPDHFSPHHMHRRDMMHPHQETEGLPVHDIYGQRVIEHDPYHQEFVHGTNYELIHPHSAPVIEHNSHAYPSPQEKRDLLSHKGDAKKIPAHVESTKKTKDAKTTKA